MRESIAKAVFPLFLLIAIGSTIGLVYKVEPFYTHYFLFIWWSFLMILDSSLYLAGGESLFIGSPLDSFLFLAPVSAFIWFIFECLNFRLQNWAYVQLTPHLWVRWPGYFLAFSTVCPGLFLTANGLDRLGVFRKNEFSRFFAGKISLAAEKYIMSLGGAMLLLSLVYPKYCFPLIWGGFIFALDPLNARMRRHSLLEECIQGNWNRTLQLFLAGLLCGGLWELWNFWAGAKWVYTVPLPAALWKHLKIFEMPVLGFLGFPPFALECFVMVEFVRGIKDGLSDRQWRTLAGAGFVLMLLACKLLDQWTVASFR